MEYILKGSKSHIEKIKHSSNIYVVNYKKTKNIYIKNYLVRKKNTFQKKYHLGFAKLSKLRVTW